MLRSVDNHPGADWIYRRLKKEIPRLSLSTVYRNLATLIEQGVIQRLPLESGIDRFEATIAPHYHLVCERCGSITDFTMPHPVDINEQAEKLSRFKITRHRIDFFGICRKCQQPSTKGGSHGNKGN
ncbi:MAG: transcriptional repressor [Chitinispirillaceae bacterium]|nr:transcriptional repressor [Chitinispirillaceae bacterium]